MNPKLSMKTGSVQAIDHLVTLFSIINSANKIQRPFLITENIYGRKYSK